MQKLLILIVKYFVFAAVFYILLLILWGDFGHYRWLKQNLIYKKGTYGHMYTRIQEAKGTKNVDILFIGSSRAYRGFDPRIFMARGFKTFNLGSGAQTPLQTEVLLNRYLDSLNPHLIIYEVNPIDFSGDGLESALDIISNDQIDIESLKMTIKLNNIKVYNTLIYSFYRGLPFYDYYRKILFGKEGFKAEKRRPPDTYISGGFVQKDMSYFKHQGYEKKKWQLNSIQLKIFRKIIKMISGKNIKLILVQSPYPESFYKSFADTDYFDDIISSSGEYHNFNKIIHLNDSLHFIDEYHLNQDGVKLFNKQLLDDVINASSK
jgi:hypothetical protein